MNYLSLEWWIHSHFADGSLRKDELIRLAVPKGDTAQEVWNGEAESFPSSYKYCRVVNTLEDQDGTPVLIIVNDEELNSPFNQQPLTFGEFLKKLPQYIELIVENNTSTWNVLTYEIGDDRLANYQDYNIVDIDQDAECASILKVRIKPNET